MLEAPWPRSPLAELIESAVDGPFGSNLKSSHYVDEAGVRVVRLQNVGNGLFDDSDKAWVSREHGQTLARHDVRPGDMLVASLGDESHPYARACVYPASEPPGIVKADCFRLRAKATAHSGFLARVMNCPSLRRGLAGLAQGVTRDRVNLRNLLRFEVPAPPLPEQRQIAAILDTLDDAIRKTEQIIAKLKQVKQGLLHDLLTRGIDDNGELRDPDRHPEQFKESPLGRIPKRWTIGSLGDLLLRIEAGKSPSCPDRPAQGDEWGVLKVSAVRPTGFEPAENKALVTPSHIEPSSEVHDGDLLITRANTVELVGLTCLVEQPPPRLLLSDKTLRLVADPERADVRYLFYASQLPDVRAQIEIHATGSSGSMKNIGQRAIRALKLRRAPVSEQIETAGRLRAVDARHLAESRALQQFNMVKRGLAEDLLTGRVRVTSLLENASE